MTRVRDVTSVLDEAFPPELAEPGDPVGLQIGRPDGRVRRVMVALECDGDVVRPLVGSLRHLGDAQDRQFAQGWREHPVKEQRVAQTHEVAQHVRVVGHGAVKVEDG